MFRTQQATEPIQFPPIAQADADGLLMIGGELSPASLLAAYRRGIFPWPIEGDLPTPWWCPDPRAILEFDDLHISRRLKRTLHSGAYSVTRDASFPAVIDACTAPRDDEGSTWITPQLRRAFIELHQQGFAHSVECWQDGELVGGVYGLAIGGYFSAESMFFCRRDASKVALVHLVEHLQHRGFALLDIQMWAEHTGRMGAIEISRDDFLRRLADAIELPVVF